MGDIELMTVIKESIDRLSEELSANEQKITFLEQSIEKAKAEVAELKAIQDGIKNEEAELREKVVKLL